MIEEGKCDMQPSNDVLLRALRGEPTEYTPIWLMRQAGRYLPEYNATRAKAKSFMHLCKTPELACEVALQPLKRFPLDAAILFSDILTIPDAMGLELYFKEGEGPIFNKPLREEQTIQKLRAPDPGTELRYVLEAATTTRNALSNKIPLIGFSGSPWTLACYMIEGCSSRDFRHTKTMRYKRPDLLSHIIQINIQAVSDYLAAQIEAGVQVVMLFDSWGGLLSSQDYESFSLNPMKEVLRKLKAFSTKAKNTPTIIFAKGGGQWISKIAQTGCNAIGVDWTVDLGAACEQANCTIQGNLDPMALTSDREQLRYHTTKVLEQLGRPLSGNKHIFNLGHGILPFTSPDSVAVLVDTVHEISRKYHE